MSRPKTTYLLGAGASALALPTFEGFSTRIEVIYDYIDKAATKYKTSDICPERLKPGEAPINMHPYSVQAFLDELNELLRVCKNQATFDVHMRQIWGQLKGRTEKFIELAKTFSFYLQLEEIKNGVDKRYAELITKAVIDGNRLSNWLKVLSWNLDTQFERAYAGFVDANHYNSLYTTPDFVWNDATGYKIPTDKFLLSKLNGSITMHNSDHDGIGYLIDEKINYHLENYPSEAMEKVILRAITNYIKDIRDNENRANRPMMSFGWEAEKRAQNRIKCAADSIMGTEILVVIGYTFPWFNRDTDRICLDAMLPTLKKVILQTMPDSIRGMYNEFEKFELPETIKVKEIINCRSFYWPF